eukprot:SAG31_NODE_1721_length_7453_cov_35.338727_2_plen_134_part_00
MRIVGQQCRWQKHDSYIGDTVCLPTSRVSEDTGQMPQSSGSKRIVREFNCLHSRCRAGNLKRKVQYADAAAVTANGGNLSSHPPCLVFHQAAAATQQSSLHHADVGLSVQDEVTNAIRSGIPGPEFVPKRFHV